MNTPDVVRACTALRHDTLGLFAGVVAPDAWIEAAATAPTEALWLLLAAEACATPIRERLGAAVTRMPATARAVFERACNQELQRILTARMQLTMIDRAAAAAGVTPILLKGAVPIAGGKRAFDLGDVDVLLPPEDCDALGRALRAMGGEGDWSIRLPGALRTDIHGSLDVGAGSSSVTPSLDSQPIPGYTHLRRLRNVPNAAYVVQHCTTHHPNRRGNLRDLMLLADALRNFSPGELRELAAVLDDSDERELHARFLGRALAINRGERPIDDEATALTAAAHYTFSLRWPAGVGPVRYSVRGMATYFFGPPSDLRRAALIYLFGPMRKGSFWTSHWVTRRAPRLSHAAGCVIRTPYRLALLAYAAAVAMAFRLDFEREWRPQRRAAAE